MDRELIIRNLHGQIEGLASLHIRHGMQHSEGFQRRRERIRQIISENGIDVRRELDPMIVLLYRRYFE